MNLDYDLMLQYVKEALLENDLERQQKSKHSFRSRYQHTLRVLGWCKRIEDDLACDKKILYTSAIFHDVGYSKGQDNHAIESGKIFLDFANKNNFDKDFTDKVFNIIIRHSNKNLLKDPNSSNELIILLEADLLDEEGALGIAWDLMARGAKHSISYNEAFEEIETHSGHILVQDYMVTKKAKEYWSFKQKFVKEFLDNLKYDLFIEE